jgi:hypothetical protein
LRPAADVGGEEWAGEEVVSWRRAMAGQRGMGRRGLLRMIRMMAMTGIHIPPIIPMILITPIS